MGKTGAQMRICFTISPRCSIMTRYLREKDGGICYMMSIRDIKRFAWKQMGGNWLAAISALILSLVGYMVIGFGIFASVMLGFIKPVGTSGAHAVLPVYMVNTIFAIILAALAVLLIYYMIGITLGGQMLFLRIVRGKKCQPLEIFDGFRDSGHMKHFALTILFVWAVSMILSIPQIYVDLRLADRTVLVKIVDMATFVIAMVFGLFVALSTIASADNPDMKPMQAIRISLHLMRKRKMKLFLMSLSFLGWILFTVVTFGVAGLWAECYITAAQTIFYLSAYGEDYQKKTVHRTTEGDYREVPPAQPHAGGAALGNIFESAKNDPQYIELRRKEQEEAARRAQEAKSASGETTPSAAPDAGNTAAGRTPDTAAATTGNTGADTPDAANPSPAANAADMVSNAADAGTKPAPTYQTEEDAWASYERWKREHNIQIIQTVPAKTDTQTAVPAASAAPAVQDAQQTDTQAAVPAASAAPAVQDAQQTDTHPAVVPAEVQTETTPVSPASGRPASRPFEEVAAENGIDTGYRPAETEPSAAASEPAVTASEPAAAEPAAAEPVSEPAAEPAAEQTVSGLESEEPAPEHRETPAAEEKKETEV